MNACCRFTAMRFRLRLNKECNFLHCSVADVKFPRQAMMFSLHILLLFLFIFYFFYTSFTVFIDHRREPSVSFCLFVSKSQLEFKIFFTCFVTPCAWVTEHKHPISKRYAPRLFFPGNVKVTLITSEPHTALSLYMWNYRSKILHSYVCFQWHTCGCMTDIYQWMYWCAVASA